MTYIIQFLNYFLSVATVYRPMLSLSLGAIHKVIGRYTQRNVRQRHTWALIVFFKVLLGFSMRLVYSVYLAALTRYST